MDGHAAFSIKSILSYGWAGLSVPFGAAAHVLNTTGSIGVFRLW